MNCSAVPDGDDTIVGLPDVLVNSNRPDGVCLDMPAGRILDVLNVSADVGLDGCVLKNTVAGLVEAAVLEDEVLGVAQQLLANQVAVDQPDVLGVPAKILSV